MDIEQIGNRIRNEIKAAKAEGWRIVGEEMITHDRGCCAIGAVSRNIRDGDMVDYAAQELGVAREHAVDIALGFDCAMLSCRTLDELKESNPMPDSLSRLGFQIGLEVLEGKL